MLGNVEDHAIGILELAFEVAMALITEIKEEFPAVGLDAFLGFLEVIDLKSEMVGTNEGCPFLDVGCLAALATLEVQKREVDHAVAHVDRRADFQVFPANAFEVEDILVECRSLVQIFHTDCKVAQASHDVLHTGVLRPRWQHFNAAAPARATLNLAVS